MLVAHSLSGLLMVLVLVPSVSGRPQVSSEGRSAGRSGSMQPGKPHARIDRILSLARRNSS